ncbi:Zinc finger, CCHC-type [Corchorus capsularis]|uniref:Zinc finger, CCHC-type n=1 Tax=Corchorus capsularis TaxID=210143 RepID=A0A1R3I2C5_COCAP|nr:Zinc finger, CCHC-type [Corchorus capsularis]
MAGELVEHGKVDIYAVHKVDDPHDAILDAVNDVGLNDVNDAGLDAENEPLGVENQPLGPGLGENDAEKDNSDDEDPEIQYARSQFETIRDEMLDELERNGFRLSGFRPIDAAEEVSGLENEAGLNNNFNLEEPYYSTDELGDFDSDDEATRNPSTFPVYNHNNEIPHIEVEMLFTNTDQFKHAVSLESILKKKGIYWVKNTKERVRAKCSDPECPWEIYASFQKSIQSFQVKKFISNHNCNRVLSTPRLSQKMLTQLVSVDIKRDPYIPYIEIVQLVSERYGLDVELSMVKRAKSDVVRSVAANYEKEFASLQAYGEEIKKANVGSSVWMQCHKDTVESPPLFQRDGNNQMFPLAWALVEVESTDSWKWFLEKLMIDIDFREGYGWVLMTDQMKGLDTAIGSMLPMAEHRFCARHMYVNWKKNGRHYGEELKQAFWSIAKAPNERVYNQRLEALRGWNSKAAKDIEKTPVRQYCRAFLSADKRCDMIDNNMCEAFNGTLLKARKLPVISLFEQIRRRMMVRIAEKRKECTRWKGNLGPNIWKLINKNADIADKCLVYESCRRYTHSGIPCAHAICAIRHKKTNIEDYVSSWYYKEVYELAYGFPLEPLKGLEDWPTIDGDHEQVHPPAYRRKPGRPKLARRKGAHENESNNRRKPAPTKMSRKGTIMTCQNCHQSGHNKRGCPKTKSDNELKQTLQTCQQTLQTCQQTCWMKWKLLNLTHLQGLNYNPKKKKANVAATVSSTQAAATAEAQYTGQLGIGNASFAANFSSSNDVGSTGNATVNITSAQQVPETVPDNVPKTSKGKEKAAKIKAAAKAKSKAKGKPPRVAGRVVLDGNGKVLNTTEPKFRTSPKSKAKLFGNVEGGNASTCHTPTLTPNWFETVSSASTGRPQQASTSNKKPRMEGYGVYTNPQGVQIEDVR